MRWRLKLMSGDIFWITEEEINKFDQISGKGLVFIQSLGTFINFSSIESIVREDKMGRENLKEGYLHDGTFVVKKFGQWIIPNNPIIKLNPDYYPEILKDEVWQFNPKEIKKIT